MCNNLAKFNTLSELVTLIMQTSIKILMDLYSKLSEVSKILILN